ncbi:MAG TPA: threonine--tRNA ligase [bacterium]|nr:threonine--tRNA ligase [bacterium]
MNIKIIRHSLAHILAIAVKELYPKVKFGIGPAIENGFYYDFDNLKISDSDLNKIEKKMKEIIKKNITFKKKEISKPLAKKLFKGQIYKLKLINELEKITIYESDNFIDLCKGPHIKSSKEININAFKLTKIAGAYWKGDEKNTMLTRIYGLAFETKNELEKHFKLLEEAEKRDHRKIGKELELFMINEDIGIGLPIFLPNGAIIRKEIENYIYKELKEVNYQWLYTPHIGSRKLWETSGHWNFYNDSMYPPLEVGQNLEDAQKGKKVKVKEEYLLKPMNCPFHVYVYNNKIRSYRDLPIKLAELGTVYRYERSGTLHGLTRVRGFTQDDAHLICLQEQINEELAKLVKHAVKMLKEFGFDKYNIYLSTRPEKYVGSIKKWEKTTKALEDILKKLHLKYQIDPGGGVFYGPKIDIKIKDSLEREWQCTTIQFDFNLPSRFKMKYIDKKGKKKEPYMIHRALLGSIERFFGILIEHYAGDFPLWLSPTQVWVIPISSKHKKYAQEIIKKLKESNYRCELKDENDTISKKIREGEMKKIPYLLIVGDREIKDKTISVRKRKKGNIGTMKLDKFIEKVKIEIEKKTI